MRILIVDDSEYALAGLKVLLNGRLDCDVCGEAKSGPQALEKAVALNPDLVLLDYSMPGMDGLQTAEELLKLLPNVMILLCTLFPSKELEREALKHGVSQVISKADLSRSLLARIDRFHEDAAPSKPVRVS